MQRAPGVPCALCLEGKENERQTSGNSRREIAKPCLRKAAVCRAPVRNETTVLLEFETRSSLDVDASAAAPVQKLRTKAGNRSAIRFRRAAAARAAALVPLCPQCTAPKDGAAPRPPEGFRTDVNKRGRQPGRR